MNIVGLEEINPFEGVYEFKLFNYNGEINLGNNDDFICNIEVIIKKLEDMYLGKLENDIKATAIVKNLNQKFNTDGIIEDIKDFIMDEIYEQDLSEDNIEVVFTRS